MMILLAVAAALSGLIAALAFSLRAGSGAPHRLLGALFGLLCVQFGLSMIQVSGVEAVAPIRPVVAMCLGPVLYLQLLTATRRPPELRQGDAVHLTGPALMAAAVVLADGLTVDLLGAAGAGVYLALILLRMRGGARCFAAWGTSAANSLAQWRLLSMAWLGVMIVADLAITFEVTQSGSLLRSLSFAVTSLALCAMLASATFAALHRKGPMQWLFDRPRPNDSGLEQVFERLEAHMATRRPWTDPDLTVARLGRQLGLSQRTVSGAVNQCARCSFSRWVNGYRVRAAMALLREAPAGRLIEVFMDVGFQTKSNFNRAFREEVGTSPSEWRRDLGPGGRCPADDGDAKARGSPG